MLESKVPNNAIPLEQLLENALEVVLQSIAAMDTSMWALCVCLVVSRYPSLYTNPGLLSSLLHPLLLRLDGATEDLCEKQGFEFRPLIFEAHGGGMSDTMWDLIQDLGKRQRELWGGGMRQATMSLEAAQRIAIRLQAENARATLRRSPPKWERQPLAREVVQGSQQTQLLLGAVEALQESFQVQLV